MAEAVRQRTAPDESPLASTRRVAARPSRPLLWGAEDLLRWVITVGLGGIVVAVAWYVARRRGHLQPAGRAARRGASPGCCSRASATSPGSCTVAAPSASAAGSCCPTSPGGRRRRPVADEPSAGSAPPSTPAARNRGRSVFLAGEGMERFHRPDCALGGGPHRLGDGDAPGARRGRQATLRGVPPVSSSPSLLLFAATRTARPRCRARRR